MGISTIMNPTPKRFSLEGKKKKIPSKTLITGNSANSFAIETDQQINRRFLEDWVSGIRETILFRET